VDLKKISRTVVRSGALFSLAVGVLVSVLSGVLTSRLFTPQKVPTLSAQIAQVESALSEISRLSESLGGLKKDLETTAKEKERIEAEYKKATELKALTDAQFAAVHAALTHKSIFEVIKDNLISFFLGVLSSLVASILWFLARQKRNSQTADES
jgi:sensor c-di-GMP phosphodiesterase-like protein